MITVKMIHNYEMTEKEFNRIVKSFMKELDFYDSYIGMKKIMTISFYVIFVSISQITMKTIILIKTKIMRLLILMN